MPLLLGRQRLGGIALCRQRQCQEFGQERHHLVECQRILRQEGLELLERLAGRHARLPLEPALHEFGDGIQGGVLVVGRPPAL